MPIYHVITVFCHTCFICLVNMYWVSAVWVANINMSKMTHLIGDTKTKIMGEGDKGEWWRGWIQLWYVVRTFVNARMYPQYNSNLKKFLNNTKHTQKLGVMVHACNPSTWEAEARGLWIQGQHGLHSKTLSQTQSILKHWIKNWFLGWAL
jgi:hypothetical protein